MVCLLFQSMAQTGNRRRIDLKSVYSVKLIIRSWRYIPNIKSFWHTSVKLKIAAPIE